MFNHFLPVYLLKALSLTYLWHFSSWALPGNLDNVQYCDSFHLTDVSFPSLLLSQSLSLSLSLCLSFYMYIYIAFYPEV